MKLNRHALALILVVVLLVASIASSVRNTVEPFKQVAMINNTMPEPEEWPIFYPVPLPPPVMPCMECPEEDPVEPSPPFHPTHPNPTNTPTKQPSQPSLPSPPPTAQPLPVAASPSPANSQSRSPVAKRPVPQFEADTPGNPHCISPQYVVCEVHPAPRASVNAFKLGALEPVQSDTKLSKWEGFSQDDATLQPSYFTEDGGFKMSFVRHTWMQSMPFTAENVKLSIGKNKGVSLVFLARFTDDFDAYDTYKLLVVGDKYTLTIADIKYYVVRGRWMFIIKTFAEEDMGVVIRTFVNDMDETEEITVAQRQLGDMTIEDMETNNIHLMIGNIGVVVDVVYAGVYDRALTAYERKGLIRLSVDEIINLPGPVPVPKALVNYDVEGMTMAAIGQNNKLFIDSSDNGNHLLYNQQTTPAFQIQAPPKYLSLTKNQRFYSQNPVSMDLDFGYSVELLFSCIEFGQENNLVVFTYSSQNKASSGERDIPDIIAQITTVDNNTIRGNLFSVFYAANLRSFECQEVVEANKWYHIVFTSDSTMFVNGVKVVPRGKAVANMPTLEGHKRYISIGDMNSANSLTISNDTGRTLVGKYALARIYNGPLTSEAVMTRYNAVKGTTNPYLLS